MGKIMTLEHLKASAAESKNYIIRRIGNLAGTVAEALEEQMRHTDESIGAIKVGGRNLLLKSATKKLYAYSGTQINHETGVAVSEWRAADAIRAYGTGGTNRTFATLSGVSASSSVSIDGENYIHSVYIKNNGTNALTVSNNSMGASQTVQPGEAKRVVLQGNGNGVNYLQFTFSTPAAGDTFDFVYWQPQIEIGTVVTDWTPAPEDMSEKPTALSVAIPVTGWSSDSDANYPKYYDIAVPGVTAADRAEVTIAPGSIGTAIDCGLCPTNETLAGKIRIRSASVPKAAISAEYWIENGKE